MRSRIEIKAIARESLRRQRGSAIALILLSVALALIAAMFRTIPFLGWLVYVIVALASLVLAVQVAGAFARIYRGEKADVGGAVNDCAVNFPRKLGGMLWRNLFVFLWALLFLIPGIVKSYSYMLTSYILSEYPKVYATDALKISMKMTRGHKLDLFVMHLSFIGWALLGALTFGILDIVFVSPYMQITMGGYYTELRDKAIANGTVTYAELGLEPAAEPIPVEAEEYKQQ